jgi:exopolyphosphatase/pppGpp-phosphohydrolase
VRLSEGFGLEGVVKAQALGRARAHVEGCFASFKSDPWPRALVAVGGSPTALVAARLGLDAFDTLRVHGETLELPTVRSWIERLSRSTVEERRCLLPATPDRAETILAGALVLEGALLRVHRPSLVVSARGLRHALAAGGAV